MNNNYLYLKPGDREVGMMLKYVPEYNEDNDKNIRDKFALRARLKRGRTPFKRIMIIAAALVLVLSTSITALAVTGVLNMSRIYEMVFGSNAPYIEQYIEPFTDTLNDTASDIENNYNDNIRSTESETGMIIHAEYDGININLISAIHVEGALRIFASVTDTTGDRLSNTLDFPNWSLNQGHGGNISVIEYNQATKTAIIMITSLGDTHIGNATLTINNLISEIVFLEDLPENNINVSGLFYSDSPSVVTQDEVFVSGFSFNAGGTSFDLNRFSNSRLLDFGEMNVPFENTDKFTISNIGFVDGALHIQTKTLDDGRFDAGYFFHLELVNSVTETIYIPETRIDFSVWERGITENVDQVFYTYSDFIFLDITNPEQLKDLSMTIGIMKPPVTIEGRWEFTFMIPEKIVSSFNIGKELPLNDEYIMIELVSMSPLGVTFHLPRNTSGHHSLNNAVYVEYYDGSRIKLNQSFMFISDESSSNESFMNFSGNVIEVERVQSLIVNGERIKLVFEETDELPLFWWVGQDELIERLSTMIEIEEKHIKMDREELTEWLRVGYIISRINSVEQTEAESRISPDLVETEESLAIYKEMGAPEWLINLLIENMSY
jgi:hypothetical protein